MEHHVCMICRSPISSAESTRSGMGAECRKAVETAKFKIFFSDNSNSLMYNHVIAANETREEFLKMFAGTKFRSAFRKSFFESMQTAERISKKQMQIMQDLMFDKDYPALKALRERIYEKKRKFFREAMNDIPISAALIETARREIRASK